MLNGRDILETITMIQEENLDVRTITMGISLLDCCDSDIDNVCSRVYEKITRCAKDLVKTGEAIEKEMGIPIVNKRISVTPAAMILAGCKDRDAVKLALTLERAAVACGVNFLGGFSALVQKGFSAGDRDKGLSDSGYETPEQAGARKKEEEKEALRRYLEKNMVSGHKEQYIDFILNYKDILDDDYVPPEPPKQQAERTAEAFGNGKGRFGGGKIYLDETPHDQAFYDSIKGLLDM